MTLRILHVDPERGFSGGETQVLALATHLREAGHEILVAAHPGGPLAANPMMASMDFQPWIA